MSTNMLNADELNAFAGDGCADFCEQAACDLQVVACAGQCVIVKSKNVPHHGENSYEHKSSDDRDEYPQSSHSPSGVFFDDIEQRSEVEPFVQIELEPGANQYSNDDHAAVIGKANGG